MSLYIQDEAALALMSFLLGAVYSNLFGFPSHILDQSMFSLSICESFTKEKSDGHQKHQKQITERRPRNAISFHKSRGDHCRNHVILSSIPASAIFTFARSIRGG